MAERKNLPKKLRFEVLKRDSFTCQYCGAQAPEVVLHVDHIKPVSKGGTNEITNLITACAECNLGKSDRELSDDSVIMKQKSQLDEIQDRREQLEMMHEWQIELTNEMFTGVDIVVEIIERISGCSVTDNGRAQIAKLIKQFGITEVCNAARIAFTAYGDTSQAFDKIGGICWCNSHVTCFSCKNFEGKDRKSHIKCGYLTKVEWSVKIAEDCEYYEAKK